ncbi:hypothetical protein KJ762_09165 [bacterium]|nr:hypothetical protein [bacterium]MBU1634662.1 hypothetical protein [bacterium]MBU1875225.1 hypothetical protein [bacterium]
MTKRLLISILIVFICFPINSFTQEKDSVLAEIEALKKSYIAGNIEKSLSILSEIEKLLREKHTVGEEKPSNLLPLMDVLNQESLVKLRWLLSIRWAPAEDRPKKKEDVLKDMSSLNQYKPVKDERNEQIAEYELISKYQNEIKKLFDHFGLIGLNLGLFLYHDKELPIRLANIDGKICLLITKVATDNVYNTLRTTAKSRAAKVLTSSILPSLQYFYNSFKDTDIAYYGMIFSYGSKDFLDKSVALNLMAEALCLIISKDNCRKFVNGEITETNLLDSSYIYISDRDTTIGFKRIEVKIE